MEGLRIGKVINVDADNRRARVLFPDSGLVSDWLTVVQRSDDWAPEIDNVVLCLYGYGFNADGYILGVTS